MRLSEEWITIYRKDIALQLRERMQEMDLKQDQMAVMIGQTQGSVTRILSGSVRKLDTLKRACDALGLVFWEVEQRADHNADLVTQAKQIAKYEMPPLDGEDD